MFFAVALWTWANHWDDGSGMPLYCKCACKSSLPSVGIGSLEIWSHREKLNGNIAHNKLIF